MEPRAPRDERWPPRDERRGPRDERWAPRDEPWAPGRQKRGPRRETQAWHWPQRPPRAESWGTWRKLALQAREPEASLVHRGARSPHARSRSLLSQRPRRALPASQLEWPARPARPESGSDVCAPRPRFPLTAPASSGAREVAQDTAFLPGGAGARHGVRRLPLSASGPRRALGGRRCRGKFPQRGRDGGRSRSALARHAPDASWRGCLRGQARRLACR